MGARCCLAIALAALAAWPVAASAHATLVEPSPDTRVVVLKPTREIALVFDDAVEPRLLSVTLRNADNRPVSGTPRRSPDDEAIVVVRPVERLSPAGQPYLLEWRVLSRDGHVSVGRLGVRMSGAGDSGSRGPLASEDLGEGVPDSRGLDIASRLLLLAGPVALLGLAVLRVWIVAPAWRSGGPRAPGSASAGFDEQAGREIERASPAWWRVWWGAAAATALGLLLAPIATLDALDARDGLGTLLGETRLGAGLIVQAGALGAVVLAGLLLGRSGAGRSPAPPAGWGVTLAAPPVVAIGAIAWAGHAASGNDAGIDIAADVLHGWAAGLWLGGLAGLVVLAIPALRRLDEHDRIRLGAGIVVRFSTLAVGSVGVLVVTGVYRALSEIGSPDELVDTGYGQTLLVKLGIFVAMMGVGAYNRFVIHPRLERAALGLDPSDRGAGSALRASVRAEIVLAALVMVAVATLVSLPPPS